MTEETENKPLSFLPWGAIIYAAIILAAVGTVLFD